MMHKWMDQFAFWNAIKARFVALLLIDVESFVSRKRLKHFPSNLMIVIFQYFSLHFVWQTKTEIESDRKNKFVHSILASLADGKFAQSLDLHSQQKIFFFKAERKGVKLTFFFGFTPPPLFSLILWSSTGTCQSWSGKLIFSRRDETFFFLTKSQTLFLGIYALIRSFWNSIRTIWFKIFEFINLNKKFMKFETSIASKTLELKKSINETNTFFCFFCPFSSVLIEKRNASLSTYCFNRNLIHLGF